MSYFLYKKGPVTQRQKKTIFLNSNFQPEIQFLNGLDNAMAGQTAVPTYNK